MRRSVLCLILALAPAGCHDPDAYVLGPDAVDAVLSVTVSANTLPADGIARATIVVQLDPRTDADKRTVTFSNGPSSGSRTRTNSTPIWNARVQPALS